ncbi:MAG: hypothetical protein PHH04_02840 [Thomasclavelia sp.]|jgi:hypothetical protein|nr:hypothetical protein [Thomasclavelia sp.]
MQVKEVLSLLNAKTIYLDDPEVLNQNYNKAFASDLMSDALALLKDETDDVLFITGLANTQSLRTAEVLDLNTIIFVRGKPLDLSIIDTAKELNINLFQTNYTMYKACGILFSEGLCNDKKI